ncbi:universal stress protein [Streptomyces sp. NPDC005931]|uniref:universal stress protein n=1 Tax=Streptomyces sp. NPDC005931 TaxID=3364737 RepID=UPI0036A600F4
MPRTITVGLDGSPASRAAADWAAGAAELRGLSLRLVHVWEPFPSPMAQVPSPDAETHRYWSERIPREAAEHLRARHPGLGIRTEQRGGSPAEVLTAEAREAELLVLGTRGTSALGGFLVGSVGLAVVAHAERPVVLVRAGAHPVDPVTTQAGPGPVVLGVDVAHPDDTVLGFAFDEAARRGTALRAVHGWYPPPYYAYGLAADPGLRQDIARQQAAALTEVLRPWREKYPDVEVVEDAHCASAAFRLAEAAAGASLVVVGRRTRRLPFGPWTGPVTHAVLHHAVAPVAVVPHG